MADIKIISQRTEKEIIRDRLESRLRGVLRRFAANMLRVIRGAGRPFELLRQMNDILQLSTEYRELLGYYPSEDLFANALQFDDEVWRWRKELSEKDDKATLEQWSADGTFSEMHALHLIHCGSLQIIASRMLGQLTQERAGERELRQGLRDFQDARDKRR
jgi:hypothetical protein